MLLGAQDAECGFEQPGCLGKEIKQVVNRKAGSLKKLLTGYSAVNGADSQQKSIVQMELHEHTAAEEELWAGVQLPHLQEAASDFPSLPKVLEIYKNLHKGQANEAAVSRKSSCHYYTLIPAHCSSGLSRDLYRDKLFWEEKSNLEIKLDESSQLDFVLSNTLCEYTVLSTVWSTQLVPERSATLDTAAVSYFTHNNAGTEN
ncbi:hypothetical protein Anapl_13716 [Anas platyrhynchos]|uniref:Uncharacterized protein n=1 Tax=Anas platyrhynchos TaxID=8839 RepID=R0LXA0_ANAPL|nr:hypothetical protein Anapl_13716 [Anas platyrhynchos]